ncbi:MAG: hypothetical protein ACREJ2_13800 [Planctomycetota bacterium]
MVVKLFSPRAALAAGLILAAACLPALRASDDSSDDSSFGPAGANYKIPDPSRLFLLQAPIQTTLTQENMLNGIPVTTELLMYGPDMSRLHDNFSRTRLGRTLARPDVAQYLKLISAAFEEDFARGNGSYTPAQEKEHAAEWQMRLAFYSKAVHEYAAFVYWPHDQAQSPGTFVMMASFVSGNDLNDEASMLRDYFNNRRENDVRVSVVDHMFRTSKSATAVKQITLDDGTREAFCVRNNLVIYAKGPNGVDDILARLDAPEGSMGGPNQTFFTTMQQKAGQMSTESSADLLLTCRLDTELIKHLPEGLQARVSELAHAAPNGELDIGAGIHFDPTSGRVQERVFAATGDRQDDPKAGPDRFLTAQLLDPDRTLFYASTYGSVDTWSQLFLPQQLIGGGVPPWLTTPSARKALGGEMAVVYYTRFNPDPTSPDYLRPVYIFEQANPNDDAAMDQWLLEVRNQCGDAFQGGGVNIAVNDNTIIAQHGFGTGDPATDDLTPGGFVNRVLHGQGGKGNLEALNFFPCYTIVAQRDDKGAMHKYILCSCSVTTLRQILSSVKQATSLAVNADFQDALKDFDPAAPGITVYFNAPGAIKFLGTDVFSDKLTPEQQQALSMGNAAVQKAIAQFHSVFDILHDAAEPSAFKVQQIREGVLIKSSSVFGHLAPLGLDLAYDQLSLRTAEYLKHWLEVSAKLRKIKLALDLYAVDTGRYPPRAALFDLHKDLGTDKFVPDANKFDALQTNDFLDTFSLLPNGKPLQVPDQAQNPEQCGLVYVEGVEDRSPGAVVVVYEAKPSGQGGTFFCLHHDGRVDTLTAQELAAQLPPDDKAHNPYSQALEQALKTSAGTK